MVSLLFINAYLFVNVFVLLATVTLEVLLQKAAGKSGTDTGPRFQPECNRLQPKTQQDCVHCAWIHV